MGLPFCTQHTNDLLHLRFGPSRSLSGTMGLFTTRPFASGDMLAPYGGEVLRDAAEVATRYGTGPDALGPYVLHRVDAACRRYVGSFANGAFGALESRANADAVATAHRYHGPPRKSGSSYRGFRLTRDNLGIKYWLVASRPIRAGDEVIMDYGDAGYAEAFQRRVEGCAGCDTTTRTR